MKRYRIKKETNRAGEIFYWPQKRVFIFWTDINEMGFPYRVEDDYYDVHPIPCKTLEEALDHINESKRFEKSEENALIVKSEIIKID